MAGYSALHYRVRRARGKPSKCEKCGTMDPSKTYEWANLSGHYDDPMDYQRLCKSCHNTLDAIGRRNLRKAWQAKREKSHCPQGHPYSDENTYVRDGKRRCRACHLARIRITHNAAYWREWRRKRREAKT